MQVNTDKLTYDVIVVGAAYAGLAAALEALRAGSKVIVLGRKSKFANNSALGGGAFALVNTPLQKEKGIKDSPERLIEDILTANGHTVAEELVTVAAKEAAELYGWLTGFGARFWEVMNFPGHSAARVHLEAGLSGANVVKLLLEAAKSGGADIRLGMLAKHLITDDSGAVKGVQAVEDEKKLEMRANSGVVLAAGGFGQHRGMMQKYMPELSKVAMLSGKGSSGDGIRMGIEVGADALNMNAALVTSLACLKKGYRITAEVLAEGAIFVNKDGKRFVDEKIGYARSFPPVMRQRDSTALLVLDERIRKSIPKMEKYIQQGLFIAGKTAGELAKNVGLDPETFQNTIREFNESEGGRAGTDVFGHEVNQLPLSGALYGTWVKPAVIQTNGGLKINSKAQVINLDGRPIPCLYAAGDNTPGLGGAATEDCPCPGYITGCGYMWALSTGRIAGRNAAVQRS